MGLCYSLRPLLFGGREDAPRGASEPPAQDARPGLAPDLAPAAAGPQQLRAGARARAEAGKERGGRPEQQRAEEREAERQARKVSRSIDRLLREQKRDLQQTHRLLLLEKKMKVSSGSPKNMSERDAEDPADRYRVTQLGFPQSQPPCGAAALQNWWRPPCHLAVEEGYLQPHQQWARDTRVNSEYLKVTATEVRVLLEPKLAFIKLHGEVVTLGQFPL